MGTNYYVHGQGVPESRDSGNSPGLHIGKKSAGWDFLFRSHPELGLTTVESWKRYTAEPGRRIIDEYWGVQDYDAFFQMALTRPGQDPSIRHSQAEVNHGDQKFHQDHDARGVGFLDVEFC